MVAVVAGVVVGVVVGVVDGVVDVLGVVVGVVVGEVVDALEFEAPKLDDVYVLSKGIATRNKKLLGAKGIATRSKKLDRNHGLSIWSFHVEYLLFPGPSG